MSIENQEYYNPTRNMHDECKKHMFYHVNMTMTDGITLDGIIEHVDRDSISVLVGEDVMEQESQHEMGTREFYGGYGGFGRPRRRFRRFRRRRFPLASLAAIALLPYFTPYPYYPYY